MERIIEHGTVTLMTKDGEVQLPAVTETIKHDDGRQDCTLHISMLEMRGDDGKRDIQSV